MTQHSSAAEEIRALLDQLHGRVETREQVTRYRQVRRDKTGRTIAVLDLTTHTTTAPGLLSQLSVVADRLRDGVILPGAAIPGGSPGWDADGALSPIVAGGKPDAAEPITEEWHVGDEIRGELHALGQELHERGWRPPLTLVDIALKDEREGAWIAGRLRGLVARARIATSYDAPVKVLRDVYCPECGGEMRVRADASSAVWCAGTWTVEGPAERGERWPFTERCGAKWPRGAWVALLDEATREAS